MQGKKYEQGCNVGSSMTCNCVSSNASNMLNVLDSVSPISTQTQASKLKPFNLNSFVVRTPTY